MGLEKPVSWSHSPQPRFRSEEAVQMGISPQKCHLRRVLQEWENKCRIVLVGQAWLTVQRDAAEGHRISACPSVTGAGGRRAAANLKQRARGGCSRQPGHAGLSPQHECGLNLAQKPTYRSVLFLRGNHKQTDEYMEVSRRSYKPVAKVLQSHHQTGHKGSRSREILKQRSQLIEWTVANSSSTDQNVLRPEPPQTGPQNPDCSSCCRGDFGVRLYQGPPGPPGPPGMPGNHGNNGNNGATGQEGAKGEKGDKGDMGPRGERGHHGPKGEKGYPGIPPELQVAFMASMATHFSNQNSGIIFSSVETNVGNFFDVMTGRFGAPVNGVYFFTFNMMKHEDVEEVYVYLMHNGNTVFSLYSYESKGKADTSGNSAVLKLAKGDEVWLRMGNGALHGDHQRFSTFAGFLLFETKGYSCCSMTRQAS
ncbi:Complement C1q tumor necrosis factor-related protein 3 isoform X1 [Aix galericulata]|nr:Complement C1q tumor necrosis factor-related protein 3 isoform X1 [Aix galericulata]